MNGCEDYWCRLMLRLKSIAFALGVVFAPSSKAGSMLLRYRERRGTKINVDMREEVQWRRRRLRPVVVFAIAGPAISVERIVYREDERAEEMQDVKTVCCRSLAASGKQIIPPASQTDIPATSGRFKNMVISKSWRRIEQEHRSITTKHNGLFKGPVPAGAAGR
jgi:hypothetical protein